MNKKGTFCGLFSILLFFTVVSCSVDLGISEKKMAAILVDTYLADGTMLSQQNYAILEFADSTQVYTPILAKYGYTVDDFRSALNLYMKNPRALESVYNEAMKQLTKLQSQYALAAGIGKELPTKEEDPETYLRYKVSVAGDTTMVYW